MNDVTVVAWPGCAWTEVAPAVALLSRERTLRVAGPSLEPVRTAEGVRIAPDVRYDEEPGEVLLVPGGDPEAVFDDPALHTLLRRAVADRLVGGICHGALLLARAGALDGRRVTHTSVPRYAPEPAFTELLAIAGPLFAGTTYVDEDVVVDGRLVTAKPWAALDFGKAVLRLAGAEREVAASRTRYLRGVRDGEGDPYTRWVALLTEVPGVPTTRAQIEAHVDHLRSLERQGRLELAGPFPGRGAGMVVIRASSEDEARAVAERDPFVAQGVRSLDLRRWLLSCDDDGHLLG
ncbi:MAG: DJ-1/PfpI family protein [Alphaproteobacteria bacterium]|nr:DJ-1/PfpI family protein [Alphaproteobacteria bacterium]